MTQLFVVLKNAPLTNVLKILRKLGFSLLVGKKMHVGLLRSTAGACRNLFVGLQPANDGRKCSSSLQTCWYVIIPPAKWQLVSRTCCVAASVFRKVY